MLQWQNNKTELYKKYLSRLTKKNVIKIIADWSQHFHPAGLGTHNDNGDHDFYPWDQDNESMCGTPKKNLRQTMLLVN